MIYEFERADGVRIVRGFPMGKCPAVLVDEDGTEARRVYTAPLISIRGDDSAARDEAKRTEEAQQYARTLGVDALKPLRGQSGARMLRDLKENRSAFAEQMAAANEKTHREAIEKQRRQGEALHRLNTPENYLKGQERKAKAAYKSRAGSI